MKAYYLSLSELKEDMEKENVINVVVNEALIIQHAAGWSTREVFIVIEIDGVGVLKE